MQEKLFILALQVVCQLLLQFLDLGGKLRCTAVLSVCKGLWIERSGSGCGLGGFGCICEDVSSGIGDIGDFPIFIVGGSISVSSLGLDGVSVSVFICGTEVDSVLMELLSGITSGLTVGALDAISMTVSFEKWGLFWDSATELITCDGAEKVSEGTVG